MKGDRTFEIIKVMDWIQARAGEIQRVREDLRETERETERDRERREKKGTGRDRGEISDNETPSQTRSLNFRRVF
jgi:hypothetical protein